MRPDSSTIPFLDLGAGHAEIRAELDAAWRRVLASNRLVLGPEVEAFEAEFAAYREAAHCVGVGNGLDALTLILRALGIGAGDEVIVPANRYIATWLAVTHAGATPVPVEPDPGTFNLDPTRVASALTPRTRAIMPVHLYGQPSDMASIAEIADRHRLPVVGRMQRTPTEHATGESASERWGPLPGSASTRRRTSVRSAMPVRW